MSTLGPASCSALKGRPAMHDLKRLCRSIAVVSCLPACGGGSSGNQVNAGGSTAQSLGGNEALGGSTGNPTAGSSALGTSTATNQSTCSPGTLGCVCYGNDTCNVSLRCQANICHACDSGTEGCVCYGNDTCNTGLSC